MTTRRILLLLACLAAGCAEGPKPIPPVVESGELVVLTLNGPATYFEDAQGLPSGFEYDLATLFAKSLGAKASFVVTDNPAKIEKALRAGQAHLAAAALARHFDYPGGLAWGPSYFTTQHQIVGRSAEPKPKDLAAIAGKRVGVIEESVAEYLLADPVKVTLPADRFPPGTEIGELLERVAGGSLDYALVESNRFTLLRKHFPQLEVAFSLGKPIDYAWLVSTVDKKRILGHAKPFFERIAKDGTLKRLVDRYYGHAARISPVDSGKLLDLIAKELPRLKPHFEEGEQVSGIDWRLIAAIAYQESHWDAAAVSPTGVRGIMMLTEETADRLKVKNRLDAREAVVGGARYVALLKEGLPPRIEEPDRTFLALAAYNLGVGHMEDARVLAQRFGLNADKWQDVRQVIGKLTDPESFQTLKHGFARGHEALQFVDNVRNYYDILTRLEPRGMAVSPGSASK